MPYPRDEEHLFRFFKYVRHLKEEVERPFSASRTHAKQDIWILHDLARGCIEDRALIAHAVFENVGEMLSSIPLTGNRLHDDIDFNVDVISFTSALPEKLFCRQDYRDMALCIDIFYLSGRLLAVAQGHPELIMPSELFELKKLAIALDTPVTPESMPKNKNAIADIASVGGSKYKIQDVIVYLAHEMSYNIPSMTAQECWNKIEHYTKDSPYISSLRPVCVYIAINPESKQELLFTDWMNKGKVQSTSRTFKTFSNYYAKRK